MTKSKPIKKRNRSKSQNAANPARRKPKANQKTKGKNGLRHPHRKLTLKEIKKKRRRKIEELGMSRKQWKKAKKELRSEKKYITFPWYWGYLEQSEAERLLRGMEDGSFLVRSQIADHTILIVSVVYGRRNFRHFIANIVGSHWKLENFPAKARTLVDLVQHYQTHHLEKTDIRLRNIAEQPDWLIKRNKILAPTGAPRLGGGNFSEVIIGAFQRRLVAIKVLVSNETQLKQERDNLMREAMIMNRLKNPYITKMIGISMDVLPPMLLVELMATSLESHIQKYGKETTFGEKILYCWQLAKALKYLAYKGIVHCDLAARNALFNRYGILKLADFGLSCESGTKKNTSNENLPVKWMAPELVKDSTVTYNEKTDVWSFGVTCNEIFQNGRKPLDYIADVKRVMTILKTYDGTPLHRLSKRLPNDIRDLLISCWQKDPGDRPRFHEIVTNLDMLQKVEYVPPLPHKQTVRLIENCTPLSTVEYETLYYSNQDWLPPVRKVNQEMKAYKKEIKDIGKEIQDSTRKTAGEENKVPVPPKQKQENDPRKVLRRLQKNLRRKMKRRHMRWKLALHRQKIREENKRLKILAQLQAHRIENCEGKLQVRKYQKRVRPDFEKLVDLYWKLMRMKWRKIAPNRETRLRLRRNRLINKESKNPMSRNGKFKRIKIPRQPRAKKPEVPEPTFPKMPVLKNHPVVKKPNTETAIRSAKHTNVGKKKRTPECLKKLKRKKKKQLRRRNRRAKRNVNKRKKRQQIRRKRRQRRRRKMRRRYRRLKRHIRMEALTWDQKDRMEELNQRRRDRKLRLYRRHRGKKIEHILKEWIDIRKELEAKWFRQVFVKKKTVLKKKLERVQKKGNMIKQSFKQPRAATSKSTIMDVSMSDENSNG